MILEGAIALVKIGILLGVVFTTVAYLTFMERRVSALIQDRLGPNRVGPMGLLQPLADGIKVRWKEEFIPASADESPLNDHYSKHKVKTRGHRSPAPAMRTPAPSR